jgi:membrane protein YqaA with SNARE-associated domain
MDLIQNPVLWLVVLLLTVSGVAFSFVKYEFGKEGWEAILKRHPGFGQERIDRVTNMYDRHGSIVLLATAIPGVDTLVTVAAGAVGVRKGPFLLWVFVAKTVRFSLLALLLVIVVEGFRR